MILIRLYHLAMAAFAGTVIIAIAVVYELGSLPPAVGAVLLMGALLLWAAIHDIRMEGSPAERGAQAIADLEFLARYAELRARKCEILLDDCSEPGARAELAAAVDSYRDVGEEARALAEGSRRAASPVSAHHQRPLPVAARAEAS